MSERTTVRSSEATSCASAAWPCATACSSTARRTGRRPCAPTTAIAVASGPKPRVRGRRRADRRRARRRAPRRGDGRHPAGQARAARGAAALPGRQACWRSPAPRRRRPASLRRRAGTGGEAALAALSLAPALIALRGGELAAYHGVEHKAIGAYEQGAGDAADAAKEHDRCGSHLVAPLLAANLAGTALLRSVVERPSQLAGAAVQLASIGAAVEVFAWSERHAGHRAGARAAPPGLRAPARARARASPTSASSRSGAPRWRRSCASKRRADSLRGGWRNPLRLPIHQACLVHRPCSLWPATPLTPASTCWRSSPGCQPGSSS